MARLEFDQNGSLIMQPIHGGKHTIPIASAPYSYTPSIPGAIPFEFSTGLTTGAAGLQIPDVTYNQAADVSLISTTNFPANLRCYVTEFSAFVTGTTAWTSGTAVNLVDTNYNVIAGIPLGALQSNARFAWPKASQLGAYFLTTVTGSASTTLKTNVSDTYVAKATCSLVGSYVTALSGTAANLGLTRIISDHDTTSFTVANAWPAAAAASDTFIMWGLQGKATMGASTVTPNAAFTPAGATGSLAGQYVHILGGTGAGQSRPVSSNTSTVLTTGVFGTAPDTSSMFSISPDPFGFGASDFGNIGTMSVCTALGAGLSLTVVGTMGAGSPLRCRVKGFIAP